MMEEKTLDQDLGFNFADFFGQTAGTKDEKVEPKKEYNMLWEEINWESETAPWEENSVELEEKESAEEKTEENSQPVESESKSEEPVQPTVTEEPENVDEAVNMILETLSKMDTAAEQWTAEIKDKAAEVQDAADKMQDAWEEDYQTLYADFSKKVEELNEIIINGEVENERMKRENAKLARMVSELTSESEDREFGMMKNKWLMDNLEKDPEIKWFVSLYTWFKWGDEAVKGELTDAISKIVKDTLWVDLKQLLKTDVEKDKNMVMESWANDKGISKTDKQKEDNVYKQMIPWF